MQQNHELAVNQGLARAKIDPKSKATIPKELERTYQVYIVPGELTKKSVWRMRDIKAQAIGSLVTVKGIVVRASDVKPQMQVAVYVCDVCGFEVY